MHICTLHICLIKSGISLYNRGTKKNVGYDWDMSVPSSWWYNKYVSLLEQNTIFVGVKQPEFINQWSNSISNINTMIGWYITFRTTELLYFYFSKLILSVVLPQHEFYFNPISPGRQNTCVISETWYYSLTFYRMKIIYIGEK